MDFCGRREAMSRRCCVKGCPGVKNESTLHRFPNNASEKAAWLAAIPGELLEGFASKSFICSLHFVDDDYEVSPSVSRALGVHMVPRLRRGVVPTNFPQQDTPHQAKRARREVSLPNISDELLLRLGHNLDERQPTLVREVRGMNECLLALCSALERQPVPADARLQNLLAFGQLFRSFDNFHLEV